ncbi:MAG TPA: Zn-dependent hydrolase [Tianweitania sediminis]|nr:Zn-dependent hydrolase [Tianweitania sediminis]
MSISPVAGMSLDRFWATIESSAKIGEGRPGGLARLTLSDADRQMRDQFVVWCKDAGLRVTVDEVGSIFARREGANAEAHPILIGSHLDTQINGGRYDGIAGVLAGLELCRTFDDLDHRTERPIEIVNWTNEEGCRYSPPMVASGCFVGAYSPEWVHERIGDDGSRFGTELEKIGYRGITPCVPRSVDAYFELHIEQGPLLHAEGCEVGVVTGGFPSHGMLARFAGETAHTGPWPMELRRNALAAGARWLTAVDDLGMEYAGTGGKATAARLAAWPNKPGILSDTADAVCDVRHGDPSTTKVMAERMRRSLFEAAARNGCEVEILDEWLWGGDIFDPTLIASVRQHAGRLGYRWRNIVSQAGHDAYFMARHCPTAMVFTPCRGGITHNNREHCEPDDFRAGLDVLLHAVLERADRSE